MQKPQKNTDEVWGWSKIPGNLCAYFKDLYFLTDTVGNRPSQSNISTVSEPLSPAMLDTQPPLYQEEVFHHENSPPAPVPAPAPVPVTPPRNNKRSKPTQRPTVDELLTEVIQSDMNRSKEATHVPDSNVSFCSSLVDSFRSLPPKKNKLARIKVLQVLYEMEEDAE